jgi:hypothetical protein
MRKYSSGYEAMRLISLVGWIMIGISIISGYIIGGSMPRGEGYIGLIIFVCGVVQGVLLLGVGAIGSAILDGSTAQQEVADHFRNAKLNSASVNVNQSTPINRSAPVSAPVDWMTIKPLPPLKD